MTNLEYYSWNNIEIVEYDVSDGIICCKFIYKGKHLRKNDEIILKSFMCHIDKLNEMKAKWLLEEIKLDEFNELLTKEDRRNHKHYVKA